MSKDLISIVIPVYNSENTINEVVESIGIVLKNNYTYEIILVEDGSKDNSYEKCLELSDKDKSIKSIRLSKNFGQHNAILAGLNYVNGELILFMDDDLQTPSSEIPKLISEIKEGYDAVYANYSVKHHENIKKIGSKFNNWMANILLKKPKDLMITSFFIIRKYLVKELVKYKGPYPYLPGLILRATSSISNVEVLHQMRKEGRSNYSLFKLFRLWLNGFTNFSVKPLRVSFFLGLVISLTGFGFSIGLVIRKFVDPNVFIGWTSIIVSILIFSGVQLILLGLAGEYIGRIFMTINKLPQYVIKEKHNV